jgi:hypothetical protein
MKNRLQYVIQSCLIIQFWLAGPTMVQAQLEQSDRLEIPTSSSRSEVFEVFTLGNGGLISLVRGDDYFGRNESWESFMENQV